MSQSENVEPAIEEIDDANDTPIIASTSVEPSRITISSQANSQTCTCGAAASVCTCGSPEGSNPESLSFGPPSYIYALGRIEPRFPSMAVEKEFAQATGRSETDGLTDQQALQQVLSQRENRYLVRQLCWILTIEGLETCILQPRDPADLDLLVEAMRPVPGPEDVDVVVGARGPIAPPDMCNGLMIPIVVFDQIYSFDANALIKSMSKPDKITATDFEPAAQELFYRVMQLADNAGATDEHRALNYLSVRYDAIYALASEQFGHNRSLSGVEVLPSRLSSTRNIVDVIFSFRHRETDVTEKYFVRVDVTEMWPFLVTKLSPYFNR